MSYADAVQSSGIADLFPEVHTTTSTCVESGFSGRFSAAGREAYTADWPAAAVGAAAAVAAAADCAVGRESSVATFERGQGRHGAACSVGDARKIAAFCEDFDVCDDTSSVGWRRDTPGLERGGDGKGGSGISRYCDGESPDKAKQIGSGPDFASSGLASGSHCDASWEVSVSAATRSNSTSSAAAVLRQFEAFVESLAQKAISHTL